MIFALAAGGIFLGYSYGKKEYTVTSDTYEITESGDIHISGPVDAHQVASSIAKTVEKTKTVEIGLNQLESIFGIEGTDCTAFSVYLAQKDTSAFEIAVFQFSSEEEKQLIMQAIQRRKAQKLASFEELNQAEYSLVEQAVIAEENGFLLFAVCKTPQKALDIFREVAKGS